MKKLYRGCIWVIILLPIMASQSVFATQNFQGKWEQTSLTSIVNSITENSSRVNILEYQYVFTLSESAEVTAKLTSSADIYLYLFSINSLGEIEVKAQEDGGHISIVPMIEQGTITLQLGSGDYFFVPTTYSAETFSPPREYTLEITFVSNNQALKAWLVNANGTIPNPTQFSGDISGAGDEVRRSILKMAALTMLMAKQMVL